MDRDDDEEGDDGAKEEDEEDVVRLVAGGGRVAFSVPDPSSMSSLSPPRSGQQRRRQPRRLPSLPFDLWGGVLSPTGVKSVRLVVARVDGLTPEDNETTVMAKLMMARNGQGHGDGSYCLPDELPWSSVYGAFGNAIDGGGGDDGGDPSSLSSSSSSSLPSHLCVSVRRYSSCVIPACQAATRTLTALLRDELIRRYDDNDNGDKDSVAHRTTTPDCEFTLLLMDDSAWLEWTVLSRPATWMTQQDLPRPGCKRVEAYMMVQSCNIPQVAAALVAEMEMDMEAAVEAAAQHQGTESAGPGTTPVPAADAAPVVVVVMDPMCGRGTFLVEAATTVPEPVVGGVIVRYIGVDLSHERLDDAALNAASARCNGDNNHRITFRHGDCTNMAEWQQADGSVHIIVTCPPFGRQYGRDDDIDAMYPQWVAEWARVLHPRHGRMVLLVDADHQHAALKAIAAAAAVAFPSLRVTVHRDTFQLGRLQATVIVAEMMGGEKEDVVGRITTSCPANIPAPLRRLPWEGHAKEAWAEWSRLRSAALEGLVPYTQCTRTPP